MNSKSDTLHGQGLADGGCWAGLVDSIIWKLSENQAGKPGLKRVDWAGPVWLGWDGLGWTRFLMTKYKLGTNVCKIHAF